MHRRQPGGGDIPGGRERADARGFERLDELEHASGFIESDAVVHRVEDVLEWVLEVAVAVEVEDDVFGDVALALVGFEEGELVHEVILETDASSGGVLHGVELLVAVDGTDAA